MSSKNLGFIDLLNAKKLLLFILVSFSLSSFAHQDIDITSLEIPIKKSFHIIGMKTGKQYRIMPRESRKIRIVGQKKGNYIIKLIDNGVEKPHKYLVAKKWARRALNFMAAIHVARLNEVVAQVGTPVGGECTDSHNAPATSLRPIARSPIPRERPAEFISVEDSIDPDLPRTVTTRGAFKPGCEVLQKGKSITEADSRKLHQCIRAIQLSITEGARKRNGRLDRATVFKNIFKRLKPEEQEFAGKIFTVHGEVGFLAKGGNYQEMMGVMKVMDNRARNANFDRQNRGGNRPFNAAHIALDPMQFSMYNAGERLWENIVDPGNSVNFSNAITSFVKYQKAKFEPDPLMNNVFHYHANYMLPARSSWGSSFRNNHKSWEVDVVVDGAPLRRSPAGYNEGSSTDRSRIARRRSLQRHRFYPYVDTGGIPGRSDSWKRKVNIPWD